MLASKKTVKAAWGSAEKWRRIWKGEDSDKGAENCPLCHLFFEDSCAGCPVAKLTNQKICFGTPYWNYRENHPFSEKKRAAAEEEYKFLVTLALSLRLKEKTE